MMTKERIIELLKSGCPKCGAKDKFALESPDPMRSPMYLSTVDVEGDIPDGYDGDIADWYDFDFLDIEPDDYLLCRACSWQEPETVQE